MDYTVLQLVDMQRVMRTRQPWAHTVHSRLLFLWLPAAIWWHCCFMLPMCSSGARWLRKLCPANSGMTRQVCLAYLFLRCFSISNSLSPLVRDYYLKSIRADCHLFTTEGGRFVVPPSVYFRWLSGSCNWRCMPVFSTFSCQPWSECIYDGFVTEGGRFGLPPSVYFHWLSIHCNWRWQLWEESFCPILQTGLKNIKQLGLTFVQMSRSVSSGLPGSLRGALQLANTQASCSKYTVQAMPKGLLYLLCASVRKMKNNRDFTLAYCLS